MIGAQSSDAHSTVKQVLVLQSFDRGILIVDNFTANFRLGLDQRAGNPVNVVQVVVDPTGFVAAPEQAIVNYIRSIYADRAPPDLIVSVAGPAAVFARKHRPQLFPGTPLLFASVDQRWFRGEPLGENESAVAALNDFPRLIDDILRLLPDTKQVFMVIGAGPLRQFWRRQLESEFTRFRDRVTFVWPDELSLPEMLRRFANLPSHSAIVYLNFGTDAQGGTNADEQVLAELRATANAPLFGAHSPLLGHGIVGGSMMSIADLARNTANVASRILNGEPPAGLRVPPQLPDQPMFDGRELQRWNISEDVLPPGSVIRFKPPSLWRQYGWYIGGAFVIIVLQGASIVALVLERRRRRRIDAERERTELELQQQRRELAHVGRVSLMGELAASLAHELSQPLTAIFANANAALRCLNHGDSQESREALEDLLKDQRRAAEVVRHMRGFVKKEAPAEYDAVDLGDAIRDVVALVRSDATLQRVEVTCEIAAELPPVKGDRVQLQQVLLNLLLNALDAMTATTGLRTVAIRAGARDGMIRVAVSDRGHGLSAPDLERVFEPFYTTKQHGLGMGLSICRAIIRAHGGNLWADNNEHGGATFQFTVPVMKA